MFITLQERTRKSLSPRRASLLCLPRGCMNRERYNAFVFMSKSASIMIQAAILAEDQFSSNITAPPILATALLCHFRFVEQIKFYTKNDVIMHCQEMILGKNLS